MAPAKKKGEKKAPTKRIVRTDIPWESIRRDFVFGVFDGDGARQFPTKTDLAEKYGVRPDQIWAVSGKGNSKVLGNWNGARKQAQGKIAKKVVERRGNHVADKLVRMEKRHLGLWEAVEIAGTYSLFQVDQHGNLAHPPRFRDLPTGDIKDMIANLKVATAAQRTIVGEPNERIEVNDGPTRPPILDELSANDLEDAARIYAIAFTVERKSSGRALTE